MRLKPVRRSNSHSRLAAYASYTALLVLFLAQVVAEAGPDAPTKSITVVFRYDDPSAKSNTEMEVKVIEAFRRHNMCCTWAVIPFVCAGDGHDPRPQECLPLPPEKTKMFAEAMREGVLELTQHGFSHQDDGLGWRSEFIGLPYEDQLQKIKQGKAFLEKEFGVPITIFVPPVNTYDANTLKVLERTGFQVLSADRSGACDPSSSLLFLPATCSVWEVEKAVVAARNTLDPIPVVVVLFHEFDFREVNQEKGRIIYDEFVQMLDRLSQEKDVKVQSVGRVRDANVRLYKKNQWLMSTARFIPRFLAGTAPSSLVYWSSEGAKTIRLREYALLTLFYGIPSLVVGVIAFLISRQVLLRVAFIVSRLLLLLWAPTLLLLCGFLWSVHRGHFGQIGLMALTATTAYVIGAVCSLLFRGSFMRRMPA